VIPTDVVRLLWRIPMCWTRMRRMMRSIHCRGRRQSPFRHSHRARWRMMRCRTTMPVLIAILFPIQHIFGPRKNWWRYSVSMGPTMSMKSSWWGRWWRWERHGQQQLLYAKSYAVFSIAQRSRETTLCAHHRSSALFRRCLARNVALAWMTSFFSRRNLAPVTFRPSRILETTSSLAIYIVGV
jgi:hypothetical protein